MLIGKVKKLLTKFHNPIFAGGVLVCSFFVLTTFSQQKLIAQNNPTVQKATQLLQAGNLSEAESLLKAYLAKTPKDLKAKILLGVVFDQQNRVVEAENLYREVLKTSPNEI